VFHRLHWRHNGDGRWNRAAEVAVVMVRKVGDCGTEMVIVDVVKAMILGRIVVDFTVAESVMMWRKRKRL